jgi:hypothetical protein
MLAEFIHAQGWCGGRPGRDVPRPMGSIQRHFVEVALGQEYGRDLCGRIV